MILIFIQVELDSQIHKHDNWEEWKQSWECQWWIFMTLKSSYFMPEEESEEKDAIAATV